MHYFISYFPLYSAFDTSSIYDGAYGNSSTCSGNCLCSIDSVHLLEYEEIFHFHIIISVSAYEVVWIMPVAVWVGVGKTGSAVFMFLCLYGIVLQRAICSLLWRWQLEWWWPSLLWSSSFLPSPAPCVSVCLAVPWQQLLVVLARKLSIRAFKNANTTFI